MPTKRNGRAALKVGLGAAAAAAAAAAGAYYFFASPESKKHRRDAKVWANRAKKDLVSELRRMQNVSEKSYGQAANRIAAKYKKFQREYPEEYARLSKELISQWSRIEKHLPKNAKTAVRQAKIAVRSLSASKTSRKVAVKRK